MSIAPGLAVSPRRPKVLKLGNLYFEFNPTKEFNGRGTNLKVSNVQKILALELMDVADLIDLRDGVSEVIQSLEIQ